MNQIIFKFLIFFIISLTFPNFSSSHGLHQSEIDAALSSANEARIYIENRIAKIFSDYSKEIQNCSSSLKAQNSPRDVSTSLDNFQNLIQQISTIKNFEIYENISTCGDINRKISLLDFEGKKLIWIREKITANVTMTYKQHSEVVRAYQINLNSLGINSARVLKILNNLQNVLRVLWEYFSSLSLDIGNLSYYNTILSVFKENYCQCLKTVSWTGKGSTYDTNIGVRKIIEVFVLKIFWNKIQELIFELE